MLWVPANQVLQATFRDPGLRGADGEAPQGPVTQLDHLGLPGGGEFIHALAMHHPGALGAEVAQDLCHRLQPLRVKDPQHLPGGARRIGQGPQQIEQGAEAELRADGRDVPHGAMVGLGKEEADAGGLERPQLAFGMGLDIDPEGGEDIGGPRLRGQGAVAVLGHLQAPAGSHEGHRGRDVQGVEAVAARPADIEGGKGDFQPDGGGPHGPGAGRDFPGGLAAHAQGGQGRTDLGRARFPTQAGGKEGLSLCGVHDLAGRKSAQQGAEGFRHGPAQPAQGSCRAACVRLPWR